MPHTRPDRVGIGVIFEDREQNISKPTTNLMYTLFRFIFSLAILTISRLKTQLDYARLHTRHTPLPHRQSLAKNPQKNARSRCVCDPTALALSHALPLPLALSLLLSLSLSVLLLPSSASHHLVATPRRDLEIAVVAHYRKDAAEVERTWIKRRGRCERLFCCYDGFWHPRPEEASGKVHPDANQLGAN